MHDFYENQFKLLAIDQGGLIDEKVFKDAMKSMGQKVSETNLNFFLKYVKKEDNGQLKVQSIIDKLSSLNILS